MNWIASGLGSVVLLAAEAGTPVHLKFVYPLVSGLPATAYHQKQDFAPMLHCFQQIAGPLDQVPEEIENRPPAETGEIAAQEMTAGAAAENLDLMA